MLMLRMILNTIDQCYNLDGTRDSGSYFMKTLHNSSKYTLWRGDISTAAKDAIDRNFTRIMVVSGSVHWDETGWGGTSYRGLETLLGAEEKPEVGAIAWDVLQLGYNIFSMSPTGSIMKSARPYCPADCQCRDTTGLSTKICLLPFGAKDCSMSDTSASIINARVFKAYSQNRQFYERAHIQQVLVTPPLVYPAKAGRATTQSGQLGTSSYQENAKLFQRFCSDGSAGAGIRSSSGDRSAVSSSIISFSAGKPAESTAAGFVERPFAQHLLQGLLHPRPLSSDLHSDASGGVGASRMRATFGPPVPPKGRQFTKRPVPLAAGDGGDSGVFGAIFSAIDACYVLCTRCSEFRSVGWPGLRCWLSALYTSQNASWRASASLLSCNLPLSLRNVDFIRIHINTVHTC